MHAQDQPYSSGRNYWSDYAGSDANLDSIRDTLYIIDSSNADNYPLMRPFRSALPKAYALVRGLGGDTWYREIDDSFGSWICIGGLTPSAPSAVFKDGRLYVAVRDGNDEIWIGNIEANTHVFNHGHELVIVGHYRWTDVN